jgi:hypothetical protein
MAVGALPLEAAANHCLPIARDMRRFFLRSGLVVQRDDVHAHGLGVYVLCLSPLRS